MPYIVLIDSGSYAGELPWEFDDEYDADQAGREWQIGMMADDPGADEDDYSYEVRWYEPEPKQVYPNPGFGASFADDVPSGNEMFPLRGDEQYTPEEYEALSLDWLIFGGPSLEPATEEWDDLVRRLDNKYSVGPTKRRALKRYSKSNPPPVRKKRRLLEID